MEIQVQVNYQRGYPYKSYRTGTELESVNEGFTKYHIRLTDTPGWYGVWDKKGKQKFEGDRRFVTKHLKKLKTRMGNYQLKSLIDVATKRKGKDITFDVVESINEAIKPQGYSQLNTMAKHAGIYIRDLLKALRKQDDNAVIREVHFLAAQFTTMEKMLKDKKWNAKYNESVSEARTINVEPNWEGVWRYFKYMAQTNPTVWKRMQRNLGSEWGKLEKMAQQKRWQSESAILEFSKYRLGGLLDSKLKKRLERTIKVIGGKVDAVGDDYIKFRMGGMDLNKLPAVIKKLDRNKNVWIGDKYSKNIWDRKRNIDRLESVNEKISKEEWSEYPKYARKLKPYMRRLLKIPVKVRVIKQANHNPWIDVRVARFGKDVIPNDFRKRALKAIGGGRPRDMDNITYGNITAGSVSLKYDQWVKLLGNKSPV